MRAAIGILIAWLFSGLACAPRGQLDKDDAEPPPDLGEQGEVWWLHGDFCQEGSAAKTVNSASLEERAAIGPGYNFSLEAGEFLFLEVEQLGVDLTVDVWRKDTDELVLRIDSPSDAKGTEEVVLFSDSTAEYVFYAIARNGEGRFRARVRALRTATREDRVLAAAWHHFSQAEMGRRSGDRTQTAAELYRKAADLWSSLGLIGKEAWAWEAMGRLYYRKDNHRAIDAFENALDLHRESQDPRQEARLQHRLARSWTQLYSYEQAITLYRASLALWVELGESSEQAVVLNDLGNALIGVDEHHLAIEAYSKALEIWRALGSREFEATTRTNLGRVYMRVGNWRLAAQHYEAVLRGVDAGSKRRLVTLARLGDALLRLDGPEPALLRYREALDLALESGDRSLQALVLNSIGQAEKRAQRPVAAVESFRRALALYQEEGDVGAQGIAKSNLAAAYEALGQTDQAKKLFNQALELASAVDSRHTLLEIHHGLARIERSRGRLEAARAHLEAALELLNRLRQRATRISMRSSFLALRIEILELMVSVLVDLAEKKDEAFRIQESLDLIEYFRSQGFIDELRAPCHHDKLDQATRTRLSEISEHINELHQEQVRSRLTLGPSSVGDGEVAWLLERYWQIEASACLSIASKNHGNAASLVEAPTARESDGYSWAQRLLDDETALLVYFLGEERSYFWVVTTAAVDLHLLPEKRSLERLSIDLHWRLARTPIPMRSGALRLALDELGQHLLGPVVDVLHEHSRLMVVTSGSLKSIPFASLPDPGDPERPLVETKEVTYLPSITALAELRRTRSGTRRGEGLAVLADPVVAKDDPRWPVGADVRSALDGMSRLDYSAVEAHQIRDLANQEPAVFELGFGAHRDRLISPDIGHVRWLHIAGHGLFDSQTPALSSLVLSAVDSSGRRRDAHIRAYEISRLRLSADLVTLSACETGLGETIRGEALTGLGRRFFAAGAGSVLVSLWPVDDAATSELMVTFYRHLWIDKDPPPRALHRAQRWIREHPRWREPYYWAAFVLYGDWGLERP